MRHIVAGTPALYACRLCAGCSIWYRVTCKIQCCKNVTTRFAPANFAPDVNATYCRRRIYSCARVGCAPLRGSGSWWHIRYSVAKMSRARWRGPGLGAARRLYVLIVYHALRLRPYPLRASGCQDLVMGIGLRERRGPKTFSFLNKFLISQSLFFI